MADLNRIFWDLRAARKALAQARLKGTRTDVLWAEHKVNKCYEMWAKAIAVEPPKRKQSKAPSQQVEKPYKQYA